MTVLFLIACAARLPTHGAVPRDLHQVGLADVQLVRDIPAPGAPPRPTSAPMRAALDDGLAPPTVLDPDADGPFLRNDYTGVVQFGGGFVREGEVALETRARLLTFSEQDSYATLGRAWLGDTVARVLRAKDLHVVPLHVSPVPVTRTPRRGSHPDDGEDNVNLPRVELTPGPIAPSGEGPAWVVVPLLRTYLAHNGGWFLGQEHGCMAGARIEALVVLYDARSGAPVWWATATGRHLDERTAQATRAQLEDYLLAAEGQVARELGRRLLR